MLPRAEMWNVLGCLPTSVFKWVLGGKGEVGENSTLQRDLAGLFYRARRVLVRTSSFLSWGLAFCSTFRLCKESLPNWAKA